MMARKQEVYGWQGYRSGIGQTREIMVASSAAEVMRTAGLTRTDWKHSGCPTGNEREVNLAWSDPGAIFFTSLNTMRYNADPTDFTGWEKQETPT